MAARGGSLSIGSEPFYDFSCTQCSKDEKHVEAIKFCVECGEQLCVACLRFHNKFETMRNHKLLDEDGLKSRGPPSRVQLPTEKCPLHVGKVVDMFCPVEDTVCCAACIAEVHRLCEGVVYIPNISSNFQSSPELGKVQLTIDQMQIDIIALKQNRKYHVKKLEAERFEILDELKSNRIRIDQHLDNLEQQARDELDSKLDKIKTQIKKEIVELEEQMSVLESHEKRMQAFQGQNNAQLFVSVKQAKATQRENENIIMEMDSRQQRSLNFIINRTVANMIVSEDSLGTFRENREIKSASLLGKYNVKTGTDTQGCLILGSCFMADGSIVITDKHNMKLKHLNKAYSVLSECIVPASPDGVCRIGPTEIAVALQHFKTIQFATVTDKVRLTRSFVTDSLCNGIAFCKGELFVGCTTADDKEEIHVYTTKGSRVRTIANDQNGDSMFSHTRTIAVNTHSNQLHIADFYNGVITSSLDGRKHSAFMDKELAKPDGVCVADDGSMIVCGFRSHNVLLVDKIGGKKCVLLSEKDGIKNPHSVLCHDSRLIVSMSNDNYIYAYRLHDV